MLNCALAAPVFLLAACTVPAPESPPPPREDPLPARHADAAPVATVVVADPVSSAHPEASSPTRALFVANCAQCHGEKGDGEGVTQLDRKARSFLDGGFSYGNTKDAILRSITHGIPGTPMPPFEKALTEAQRVELAQYVIAFGPDQIVVDPSESEIVVTDRPVIVRGKLPPIYEGEPEIARGLAIGLPDGFTFEYRTDDVRFVGARAGRFVNRADWGERGGTALEMLGQRVYPATKKWAGASVTWNPFDIGYAVARGDLQGRFRAIAVEHGAVVLTYDLVHTGVSGHPAVLATVEERPSSYRSLRDSRIAGFRRGVRIHAHHDLKEFEFMPSRRNPVHGPFGASDRFTLAWNYAEYDSSYAPYPLEVVRVENGLWRSLQAGPPIGFIIDLEAGQEVNIDVFVIPDVPLAVRSEAAVVAEFGDRP